MNAKQKIGNKELIPYIKDIVTNGLEEFFSKNQAILNDIIKLIKLNVKARIEAVKAKNATQIERLNTFSEHSMSNYIRCNNTGKQWKEIFLVEGLSAGGSARNGWIQPQNREIYWTNFLNCWELSMRQSAAKTLYE